MSEIYRPDEKEIQEELRQAKLRQYNPEIPSKLEDRSETLIPEQKQRVSEWADELMGRYGIYCELKSRIDQDHGFILETAENIAAYYNDLIPVGFKYHVIVELLNRGETGLIQLIVFWLEDDPEAVGEADKINKWLAEK